jgi:hypothetical protein
MQHKLLVKLLWLAVSDWTAWLHTLDHRKFFSTPALLPGGARRSSRVEGGAGSQTRTAGHAPADFLPPWFYASHAGFGCRWHRHPDVQTYR